MSPRRSNSEARQTHQAIVRRAAELASGVGLEGLTIGRLADDMHMSKAGVINHFGSKQTLQLATLKAAVDEFVERVWTPAAGEPPGARRLAALCDAWLDYLASDDLPDGCFITAASCEFDGRPGPVRDAIAAAVRGWQQVLAAEAATALANGELPDCDPAQLAFELNALVMGANQARQLLDDPDAFTRARSAIRRQVASPPRSSRGARPRRRSARSPGRPPAGSR